MIKTAYFRPRSWLYLLVKSRGILSRGIKWGPHCHFVIQDNAGCSGQYNKVLKNI